MRLLHGSNVEVRKPDLSLCHSKNDFGRGFYLTPNWNRAWEMGKRRKNIQQKGEITVSAFNYKREFPNNYLEDEPLKVFIERVSQFGSSYVQYCFCTDNALNELKKI